MSQRLSSTKTRAHPVAAKEGTGLHGPRLNTVSQRTGLIEMTEELTKTEARQGDRRRMNKTVMLIGIPLALVLLGVIAWTMA